MKFKNFEIHAIPHITDAYCSCGGKLYEVPDGFLSAAMFCPKCENIYALRLMKIPNVRKEFLKQCREAVKNVPEQRR